MRALDPLYAHGKAPQVSRDNTFAIMASLGEHLGAFRWRPQGLRGGCRNGKTGPAVPSADPSKCANQSWLQERATGLELATSSLGRRRKTKD